MDRIDPADVARVTWEGQAQIDIADLIDTYVSEHPAPCESSHLAHWANWSGQLREAGGERLQVAQVADEIRSLMATIRAGKG